MFACADTEQRLAEYVDGLLSQEERVAVEAHLAQCVSCDEQHECMLEAVRWVHSAATHTPPEWLVGQILANTPQSIGDPVFGCGPIQERLSELIDGDLSAEDAQAVTSHLNGCVACREIHRSMTALVRWGREFPVYEPPEWLATRILASTPRVQRETWVDTLRGLGRWIFEPRTAMTILTSVLVMGWLFNLTGLSLEAATRTSPREMYYSVEELADDVYDRSVRFYYGVPHAFWGEVQARIEELGGDS